MDLKNKTLLFQGDSITDMARRESDWDMNHIYGHSFVFLLAGKLHFDRPNDNIKVINRGVSGDRISDIAARWQTDALDLSPDIISLLVGVNDLIIAADNGQDEINPEEYENCMQQLIDRTLSEKATTQFIICEPFCFVKSANEKYAKLFSEAMPRLQKAAKRIAAKNNFLFVPLQEEFNKAVSRSPEQGHKFWLWDGIHPTAAGHLLIEKQWLKYIEWAG